MAPNLLLHDQGSLRITVQFIRGRKEKMKRKGLQKVFFLYFSLVLIIGCASPISRQLRQEADKNLTFTMVKDNPQVYKGKIVIWGGMIIETVNQPKMTEITVLESPLGSNEKPGGKVHSQGRFIARSHKYLDPEVYKKGRKVTVAGEVTGKEVKPVGKMKYAYPVINVKQLYLWNRTRAVYTAYDYYGGWDWYSYFPSGSWYDDEDDFDEGGLDEGDFDEGDSR